MRAFSSANNKGLNASNMTSASERNGFATNISNSCINQILKCAIDDIDDDIEYRKELSTVLTLLSLLKTILCSAPIFSP